MKLAGGFAATLAIACWAQPVVASADTGTTAGRISLTGGSSVIIDTRSGGTNHRLTAGTDLALWGGTVESIMVLDATADGTAVVHPCGEPVASGTDPDFVFGPGDVEIKQFTIEQAGSTCFLATTPVHVKVTLYGSVIDVPAEYGLQYRALASPVTVLDEVYQFNGIGQLVPLRLPRPDVIPPDAPSIVYRIDVQSSSRTYGILANCNSTTNDDATFSANAGAVSTVAYRGISAGVDNCLYTFGDGVTALQVSVLGWLDWTGPDPSSVPPTLRSHEMLADPPGLSPIPPRRVLDTRTGIGSAKEQLLDDQVLSLDLTPYITDSTTSVVMNVTATQSTLAGYVTVFPCDADIPDASNLNFAAGQDVPNLVSVPVALDGTVCFVTSAATHLIADLAGTFEVGAGALGTGSRRNVSLTPAPGSVRQRPRSRRTRR